MNNYPRRLLGWQRPADLMAAECAALGAKMPAGFCDISLDNLLKFPALRGVTTLGQP